MPLKTCSEGGKTGLKWGDSGKCYTGSDAKSKALAQGEAIKQDSIQEEIDAFFEKAKQKQEIDPELQRKIDIAKGMSTWELLMNPPWDYEEDYSPDLMDVDIDVKMN
tara:strand:+ start:1334 stop:1654 length:321 start_codon:yes stop_codon:yes gene_type:complete